MRNPIIIPEDKITKLSINIDGVWKFSTFPTAEMTKGSKVIYKVNQYFGLVRQSSNNPAEVVFRGLPGERFSKGLDGSLALINESQYNLFFISPNSNPVKFVKNSDLLNNPNYISDSLSGKNKTDYNTVVANTNTGTQTPNNSVAATRNFTTPTNKPCNCN